MLAREMPEFIGTADARRTAGERPHWDGRAGRLRGPPRAAPPVLDPREEEQGTAMLASP
jgi:hypothetical protein